MGRRFPAVIIVRDSSSVTQSEILSLAFLCMAITASLGVISALCGTRFRRKTNTTTSDKVAELQSSSSPQAAEAHTESESCGQISIVEALPPPPARRQLDSSGSQSMKPKSNTGELAGGRKLSSMSMSRVGRSLSVSMRWSMKEGGPAVSSSSSTSTTAGTTSSSSVQKMKAKLEKEDSIWMKTIILGEKCRVEDEDDPVIFDDRGLRVTAYHPKVGSSLPVSRSSSYIDQDAIPSRPSNVLVLERAGEASN